ncbi:hypothetical protein C4K18_0364 [Pseudomonas chlororaphis subsp. aurantiaca]|nr:hypothetical protein C4K18_0364 [Pseudomonas chlororaphis subsp. aurantiaca]
MVRQQITYYSFVLIMQVLKYFISEGIEISLAVRKHKSIKKLVFVHC